MGHSKVEATIHYLRNVHKDENPTLAFKNLGLSKKVFKGVQSKIMKKIRETL